MPESDAIRCSARCVSEHPGASATVDTSAPCNPKNTSHDSGSGGV